MTDPIVSIMMPAYNAEKYIGQAIESVLAQTCQDWRLVVIEDGSTDATPEILSKYNDPRISVFHQPNGGEASARNAALSHIDSEYLAFLDADDLFLPDHLAVTVGYLEVHPERDGVYTDGEYINQNGVPLKPLSSRRRGPFEGDIFEQMIRASDVFGAPVCVVLRRNLIEKNQLTFDPQIVIGPDWDFLIRFSAAGEFGFVNQRTCLYRVHPANISLKTNQSKRIASLAKCREKAIRLPRFNSSNPEIRKFVFYELLINILAGCSERQRDIIGYSEFTGLPPAIQGDLLRLMANQAIVLGEGSSIVWEWFKRAKDINPGDWRCRVLEVSYRISPKVLSAVLRKRCQHLIPQSFDPFKDLKLQN